ncbi:MAG: HlyD family efflux transporter periplasmic adaptor subunit [Oceanicaulis sp.]
MSDLFRREAIDHHARGRLDGAVVLAVPLAVKLLGGLAALIVIGVVVFASLASYSRKETVPGWLTPDQGVVRAAALSGGRVEEILVAEGDAVRPGDPLARVRLDTDTASGAAGARILDALREQAAAAAASAQSEIAAIEHETARLTASVSGLTRERAELARQIALQRDQVEIADEQITRAETLAERGFLSGRELDDRRQRALAARQQLAALERALAGVDRQISDARAGVEGAPLQIEAARARARSAAAALEERLSAQGARTEAVITAPAAATVAALPVRRGQTLSPGETVAVLVPEGGSLVAELYIPSRAAGFIQAGQSVRLMYQAYPHQRFGAGEAVVTHVSRTVIAPNEAAIPGLQLAEPVFRVEARLSAAQIEAYGELIPLQPGLMLSADIIIDERTLIEWLFDPLFAAGRRG